MSFDLYFAGIQSVDNDVYICSKNACRLFSWADKPMKRLTIYNENKSKIFMDSGAYGVAHSNKEITLDEYINLINNTPRVNLFACLDVIPFPVLNHTTVEESANKSWENYIYMLENVNPEYKDKIVPTYHYGEDFKHLKQILNGYEGYKPKYIAYGGRAGISTKYLYSNLDEFFKTIQNIYPEVKTHAFGITVLDLLNRYPFTSADSTSYLKTATFGCVFLECLKSVLKISEQTQKDPKNFIYKDPHYKKVIQDEIEKYGYTVKDLQQSFKARMRWNVDYFLRWSNSYEYKSTSKTTRRKLF